MTQKRFIEANQLVYSGLKEILGLKELARMTAPASDAGKIEPDSINMNPAKTPDDEYLQRVQAGLEKQFGQKELQGLLQRTGRAACKFFVRQYGPAMQVTSTEYRLLPTRRKLIKGLKAAANLWSELFGKQISLQDNGDHWVWQNIKPGLTTLPYKPAHECFFTIGLMQEYMAWLSGGKVFQVKKAASSGLDEGCYSLKIIKQPME